MLVRGFLFPLNHQYMDSIEKKVKIGETDLSALLGYNDLYLTMLESRFQSSITVRGDTVIIRGEPAEVKMIEKTLSELQYILGRKGLLTQDDVSSVLQFADSTMPQEGQTKSNEISLNTIVLSGKRETIKPRNKHQAEMVSKVMNNDLCFAVGPAGTGKTYLAVALALAALKNNEVTRIVLSRPAVEAGESLGFLPGDLSEKVDPYLRPLLDAITDMVSTEKFRSMSEKRIIEIVPLAYMRGRTLNNSFIILDEAQNATRTQMKMFLTRLGRNSKCIVTGDITQIDLPYKKDSGLVDVERILQSIPGIEFVYFDKTDVVRHRLVADIIHAYELSDQAMQKHSDKSQE
jgi:phosphate starvation-inducible protein PhoH and related proteins